MRKTKAAHKTPATSPSGAATVTAKVPAADLERIDAYGEQCRERTGLEPKRGPLLLALARKGLEMVEREAVAS